MFKSKPKVGDYRVEEIYIASANAVVFKVQKLCYIAGIMSTELVWDNLQTCSTLESAMDMIAKYKRQDKPIYHYP